MAGHHLGYSDILKMTVKRPSGMINSIYTDAIIVLALVVGALLSMYLPDVSESILRFGMIIVLFMFVPGYALVAALYPRKSGPGGIERIALSVGMSLVVSPLIGFALNFTSIGIQGLPFALSIAGFAVVLTGVALLRRTLVPKADRFSLDLATPASSLWNAFSLRNKNKTDRTATVVLMTAILLVIVTVGFLAAVPVKHEQYTEFYLYGKNSTIAEYPLKIDLGESAPVIVGISNHEGATMTYDLAVTIDGIGSQRRQIYSDRFVLADNDTLEKAVNITFDRSGGNQNLQFLLYLDGMQDSPYRACNLWVNVTSPPSAVLPANGSFF